MPDNNTSSSFVSADCDRGWRRDGAEIGNPGGYSYWGGRRLPRFITPPAVMTADGASTPWKWYLIAMVGKLPDVPSRGATT